MKLCGWLKKMGLKWVCAGLFGYLLVCLILMNAVDFCNGGITSSFVREKDLTLDMPIYSDVFRVPPGYNSPQQVCSFNLWIIIITFFYKQKICDPLFCLQGS